MNPNHVMINDMFHHMSELCVVDWGVILLGCKGLPVGTLSPEHVSDFACKQLDAVDSNEKSFILLTDLALCASITHDIIDCVDKLCEQENIDLAFSKIKWTIFALNSFLESVPQDCLYGILSLNEFWNDWGTIFGCPNVVQGVNNDATPVEFYSESNFKTILLQHRKWVAQEINHLMRPGSNLG